jgi:hypothetical protein
LKIIGLNEKPLNNNEIIETLKRRNEEFFDESCDTEVIHPFACQQKVIKLVGLKNGGRVSPTNLITFACPQNGE